MQLDDAKQVKETEKNMAAKMFGSRLSPYVEKVARAMNLKGVAFELIEPKTPGDFKKWNPQTQKMPVLELDGQHYHDSTFILRKLDEIVPAPALFSDDPKLAAQQRFIEDWSDESLYFYMMGMRWAPENEKDTVAQVAAALSPFIRPIAPFLLPRLIGGQARAQGLARLPLSTLTEELARRFDELLVLLGDSPFFYGDRVSGADMAVFGQMNTMRSGPTPQAEDLIAERPRLVELFKRVDAATQPQAEAKKSAKLEAA